jgi:hypothetical protein
MIYLQNENLSLKKIENRLNRFFSFCPLVFVLHLLYCFAAEMPV